MGAPLSAAEKLQAIPGSLTTWINELLKKYVLEEDTLTEYIDWDVSRGKPFQIIASMTAMCWYTESRKVITAIDLKKWLEKDLDVRLSASSLVTAADRSARRRVQEEDGDGLVSDDPNREDLQVSRFRCGGNEEGSSNVARR